jgi:hypothetical protein
VSYTLTQKIACLERELRFRFRVYPRRMAQGLMSQATAAHEIKVMTAILDDYRKQREPELRINEVPQARCLNCNTMLDAASDLLGDARPNIGDLTICIKCGHLMAFTDDLMLRELTDQEIKDYAGDPRIVKLQNARGRAQT